MIIKHKLLAFILLLALLFAPTGSVAAAGDMDGKVIFGSSFTLKSGESMHGDLVVFGGVVVVEEGATVNGSVVLIGGTLTIDGEVTVDAVLIGGTANLGSSAYVHGDLVTVGGTLQRDKDARVDGEIITNIPAPEISIPVVPSAPAEPNPPGQPNRPQFDAGYLVNNTLGIIGRILVITILAVLSMLFLQQPAERVAYAVTRQPVIVGGVGLLTVVLAPLVIVLLAVTLILIPLAALVVLALILAWLMGVIAIGLEVGQRFTAAINQQWPVVLTAGFGTFLTITSMELLNQIECLGWLISLVIGLLAIGGVVITFFGSRSYPPMVGSLPPAALPPSDQPAG